MPVRGRDKLGEESRQSWFSHQSETAKPYYYSVYLADHDIVAEMTPTERAAVMRFVPRIDGIGRSHRRLRPRLARGDRRRADRCRLYDT